MKMKITYGKKEIELKSVKSSEWDIEKRASLRTDNIHKKFHLISWKIVKKKERL